MPYKTRIPEITAELESGLEGVVSRAGHRIEAGAKRRARVDTGYMRGQIRWIPDGPMKGSVIGGADYTIFNEYGTIYMSAQPMFGPAIEEVRPQFDNELRVLLRKVTG